MKYLLCVETDYIELELDADMEEIESDVITNLKWSRKNPGSIELDINDESFQMYTINIRLIKDGKLVSNSVSHFEKEIGHKQYFDIQKMIDDSGEYRFVISVYGIDKKKNEEKMIYKKVSEDVFKYVKPNKKLDTIKSVQSGRSLNLSWENVKNAAAYNLEIVSYDNGGLKECSVFDEYITSNQYKACILSDINRRYFAKFIIYSNDISKYQYVETEEIEIELIDDIDHEKKYISNASWDTENFGCVRFDMVSDKEYLYVVYLVKDGKKNFETFTTSQGYVDFRPYFDSDAEYSFGIICYNHDHTEILDEYLSEQTISYVQPSDKPEEIHNVSAYSNGMLGWDFLFGRNTDTVAYYQVKVTAGDYKTHFERYVKNRHVYIKMLRDFDMADIEITVVPTDIRKNRVTTYYFYNVDISKGETSEVVYANWDKDTLGVIDCNICYYPGCEYYVILNYDNGLYAPGAYNKVLHGIELSKDEKYITKIDVRDLFFGDGDFNCTFIIYAVYKYDRELRWAYESDEYIHYSAPKTYLPVIDKVEWYKDGVVTWDKVENADSYIVYLYDKDRNKQQCESIKNFVVDGDKPVLDLSKYLLNDSEKYCIQIEVITGNLSKYKTSITEFFTFNSSNYVDEIFKLKLVKQPTDYFGVEGEEAIFSVKAEGKNLTYNWQWSRDLGDNWYNSTSKGANTDTLIVPITKNRVYQWYRCVITNQLGNEIITDIGAIYLPSESFSFAIISQPSDYVGKINTQAFFSVYALGNGVEYRWQFSNDNGKTWHDSSAIGSKSDDICIDIIEKRDGQMYRCVVTDIHGEQIISDAAKIKIDRDSLKISKQPTDYEGEVGQKAVFEVGVCGENLMYQWQFSNDNGNSWHDSGMNGAKSSRLEVEVLEKRNGQLYRCQIKDKNGKSLVSECAKIIAIKKFAIIEQPKNFEGKIGQKALFNIKVQGEGLTYQWQFSCDKGYSWHDSGAIGANTQALEIEILEKRNGQLYRCVVIDYKGEQKTTEIAKIVIK